MERFTIRKNDYLSEHTLVYYHQPYLHYQEPGNPDFLNVLKNLINDEGQRRIDAARQEVYDIVHKDLPAIMEERQLDEAVIVVVPRSKVFTRPSQLGFRLTIQDCVRMLRANGYPKMVQSVLSDIQKRKQPIYVNFYEDTLIMDLNHIKELQRLPVTLMLIWYEIKLSF